MAGEGYSIIPISSDHQLAYGCNVLNLGGSRIISVHAPSARRIVAHPSFKGDVRVIDFSSITWATGGGRGELPRFGGPRSRRPRGVCVRVAAARPRRAAPEVASAGGPRLAGTRALCSAKAEARRRGRRLPLL